MAFGMPTRYDVTIHLSGTGDGNEAMAVPLTFGSGEEVEAYITDKLGNADDVIVLTRGGCTRHIPVRAVILVETNTRDIHVHAQVELWQDHTGNVWLRDPDQPHALELTDAELLDGAFRSSAQAWVDGDYEPSEVSRRNVTDLAHHLATWRNGSVELHLADDRTWPGSAQALNYLGGDMVSTLLAEARKADAEARGVDQ